MNKIFSSYNLPKREPNYKFNNIPTAFKLVKITPKCNYKPEFIHISMPLELSTYTVVNRGALTRVRMLSRGVFWYY